MLTFIARRHLINRKTTNHFIARAPLFATSRRMASFTVKQGLNLESRVPDAQMLIIGRKSLLKDLALTGPLVEKLKPVDEAIFKHAIDHINSGNGSVSLFTDLIKIVSVPEELSRHNTPSNAYAILKEVKSTKLVKGIKKLNILLYTDYQSSMASIVAIARAFPLFSMKSKNESSLESVEVELMLDSSEKSFADNEVTFLQTLCDNVRTCCRLVDTPASILHTEALLDEALKMVDETGVPIAKTIIKGRELLDKGFGGIYSVGQAAKRPPIFACFSHTPAGATHRYALVGKGIVYDTGGLSLKGKTMMPSMKIDMGGAAAVLSAFSTLVKAGFTENLHCLMCIAENHISPEATRPDDIIKMLSGKTVEVNNTDAEGRLVLADGVYYAKTTLKADTIIDMATLTGAQAMATGKYHAAIVCNSDALEEQCVRAGRKSGELVHPLPFVPELHFSDLGSKVADMKNAVMGTSTGPPTAVAGLFIGAHIDFGQQKEQQQKEDGSQKVNWLHIDMAGLTGLEKWDGRATGYGVALLCSLLANHTNIGVAKMQQ